MEQQNLIEMEDESRTIEKIWLENIQCIDLAAFGYTTIKGKMLFKKKRFDSVIDAKKQLLDKGDIIAECKTAAFILSPNQNESVKVMSSLSF